MSLSGWIQIRGSDTPDEEEQQQDPGWITVSRDEVQRDETPTQREFTKYGNGSHEYSAETGAVTHTPPEQADKGSIIQHVHGTGILGTASELNLGPETVVRVPTAEGEISMQLRIAERLNYVRRDASGHYVEVPEAERVAAGQQANRQPEQTPEEKAGLVDKEELFSPEIETALAEMVKDVPPELLAEAIIPAVIKVAKTGVLDINPEKVASQTGMTKQAAATFLNATLQAFDLQASQALVKLEVDPDHFANWARANRQHALVQAMVDHFTTRSLAAYRRLAGEYLFHTQPSEESLKAKGYEVKTEDKTLMIKLDGIWTSVKAAARDGRI